MKKRIKLILAIRALNIGGAERQFLEIAKKIDRSQFEIRVISMYPGHLDEELNGLEYHCFGKKGRFDFFFFIQMFRFIKTFEPDVVYSFMPAMNIIMAVGKLFTNWKIRLIWGQFGSKPDYAKYPKLRRNIYLIQKKFEFLADAITADGNMGIEFYKELNMKLKNTKVIFSGTDIERFNRNDNHRAEFRRKYNLDSDSIAIGICSRLDVMKGYLVLAEAAKRLLEKHKNIVFFSIGYGDSNLIDEAKKMMGEHSNRFIWLGKQLAPEEIMSGWDIYCSPSLFGEGFSNAIIEAMSCSLPMIVTDVGEAKHQVQGVGIVIIPGDANDLYDALDGWIIDPSIDKIGIDSRERVVANFSSSKMTKETEDYIKNLVSI